MFNSKKNEKSVKTISILLLSTFIIICETPYLSRNLSTTIVMGIMFLYLVTVFRKTTHISKDVLITYITLLLYVLIEIMYKLMGISTAGIGYYFATLKFLFIFFAMLLVYKRLSSKQKIFLCTLSILCMLINMLSNIQIYLQTTPTEYVVYYLTAVGEKSNAADTAFSSAVMLLMGACFISFLHIEKFQLKIISICCVIFCMYYTVFIAQRGTTFFLSILMLLMILLFQVSSRCSIIVILILGLLMIWLSLGGAITVLKQLSVLLGSERISIKINYMINLFQTGDVQEAGGSLTSRANLIKVSMDTFFSSFRSFIFGMGDQRENNLIVGNHSQFVDTFARYGIIGGICMISLLIRMENYIIKCSSADKYSSLKKQVSILFIFFIIRSFLGNTFIGSIGTQLFVTVPLLASILMECKGDGHEKVYNF